MGVEVSASDMPKVNGEANGVVLEIENGKVNESEPITFGSQGVDEPIAFGLQGVDEQPAKGEVKNVSNSKNAADEWPAEPQVHYFWFVKYRPYEDPKLKAEIEKLDKDVQKKSAVINQLYEEMNAKKAEKDDLHALLASLGEEKSQYQEFIDQKRQEMKPLTDALGREKGGAICSSEEELNGIIRSLEYRIQHESMPLKEEKQILREIRELEATRPRVVELRANVPENLGHKEAIQDQVKLLGTDLDGVKKQKKAVTAKREQLYGQAKALKVQIDKLKDELTILKEKKNAAVDSIRALRSKRDEENKVFYENRALLNSARDLAAKKDVKAIEELANIEVEKFMSEWNSNKAFRNNYEKRILLSLDMRQLSRDGRMRNFDEKPLVNVESPASSETVVTLKATGKTPKEDRKTTSNAENVPTEKAQNETKNASKESKGISERAIEEDIFVVEKPKKDVSKDKEVDAAKLKEMKKEEEKEKQRQALERKKKLQEKAAAKAALRAQKEAEKKQKDREKKLKKKEGSSVQPTNEDEPSELPDGDEPDKSDNVEEPIETPAPLKAKGQKETVLRHRKSVKTRTTLPKAILKKKKSPSYLLWGSATAAAVVVLLLLAFGYNYLQKPQVVS